MIVGIFDSGLGGLTVVKEFKRKIPNASFIYLGDTARFPTAHGVPKQLENLLKKIHNFWLTKTLI